MTPTETLKHEHEVILLVLQAAEHEADTMRQTGWLDAPKLRKFLDFFTEFVDRCHHAKEEKHLFVRMKGAAPEAAQPVDMMLREHEEGRAKVAALRAVLQRLDARPAAAGPAEQAGREAAAAASEGLRAYADLLRRHIFKEDNVLYPIADRVLDKDELQTLAEEFDFVESQELGQGVHEKYHQLAHELAGVA